MVQSNGKKKLFLYFIIFILLSTISNKSINNQDISFFVISNINVLGLSSKNNLKVKNDLSKILLKNIFLINKDSFIKILSKPPIRGDSQKAPKCSKVVRKHQVFKGFPACDFDVSKMHELPTFLERFWAEMPQKCFKNLRFLKGLEHVGNVAVALRFRPLFHPGFGGFDKDFTGPAEPIKSL